MGETSTSLPSAASDVLSEMVFLNHHSVHSVHTCASLLYSFFRMGFEDPLEALVVLSGSHNIGRSRVTAGTCSQGFGHMTTPPNRCVRGAGRYSHYIFTCVCPSRRIYVSSRHCSVALPLRFDGHYYHEVVRGSGEGGWFFSDRALKATGAATAPLMQRKGGGRGLTAPLMQRKGAGGYSE